MMFKVQILGTSAAVPALGRNVSAQVVTHNERCYLIDCGEGTQMQFVRYKVKAARLDAIFISHLHGDHILGLPGLLSTFSLDGRQQPLKIFAPAALEPLLKQIFRLTNSYLSYKIQFIAMEDFAVGETIFTNDNSTLCVKSLPLIHRIFCRGFHFEEMNKSPKFDFFKAKALEIPNSYFHLLKQGNAIILEDGREILPEQVMNAPDVPKSYSYCSDTVYNPELVPYIQGSDLLYHEATFLHDMESKAFDTKHTTAKQAAMIAQEAQVKKLLLGHFSARYKDLSELEKEAKEIFPHTETAIDGHEYEIGTNKFA
jgi:ribonuclease Z